MKKICVCNQKGGSCKTSFTALLSLALAGDDKRVLCIDTDPQNGLTSFFKARPKTGTLEMIMGKVPEILTIDRHGVFIDLIGADYHLDKMYANVDYLNLKRALAHIDVEKYDYVLFDTPPTMIGITRAAAVISDSVYVSADISESTIGPTLYTLRALAEIEKVPRVVLIGKAPGERTGYVADLTRDFIGQLGSHFVGFVDRSATMQKVVAGVTKMSKGQREKILGVFND